jgi:hypothetical protein
MGSSLTLLSNFDKILQSLVNTVSYRFSFAFKDKIWKMVIDQTQGKAIVELRSEVHSISYHIIDLIEGKERKLAVGIDDPWSIPVGFVDPYLLIETFTDPNDPQSKNLSIFNVVTESKFDTKEGFQMEQYVDDSLIGYYLAEPEKPIEFKIKSSLSTFSYQLLSPNYYRSGSNGANLVQQLLPNADLSVGCEYFEQAELIIISYYERLGTTFARKMIVIRRDETIYHETTDVNLTGFASGAFMIYNDLLIFIENSNQLHAINI